MYMMERKSININNFPAQGAVGVFIGIAAAFIIMLLCSFFGSGIVYFTHLPESSLHVMAIIVNIFALGAGGFISARKAGNRGLIRGLTVGFMILLLMLAIGSVTLPELALKAGYCLPAAALGGVCGIKIE